MFRRSKLQVSERRSKAVARPYGGTWLDSAHLAAGVWRRRIESGRGQGVARGDGQDHCAITVAGYGHLDDWAGDSRIRLRCPQTATSAGDCAWRDSLVSGLQRTEFRSDLAGLQTRAVDQGDHFIVNGQKVWTSNADISDWMFCLVRTDTEVRKHVGISLVLLFDMETEGVSARPIRLISGTRPYFARPSWKMCALRRDQVVGEINNGWTIAKYLLTHEREMIGGIGNAAGAKTMGEEAIAALGRKNDQLADGFLRAEVAQWEIDFLLPPADHGTRAR